MTTTFTFHCDPGHGWLAVPVEFLKTLNLSTKDFSLYSYRKGGMVYLEEDCDAPKVLKALKERNVAFKINESHTNNDSFVRNFPSIY